MKRLMLPAAIGACAVIAPYPSASAAGTPPSPLGYAITAVGFKSYFVFDSRPGDVVRATLSVVNLTTESRTIQLAPVDVSTASAGALQYGDSAPLGDGRWLDLAARSVRLPARTATNVALTVRVPRTVRPGDHFLGITAVDRRVMGEHVGTGGPIRLRLIPRLAMTIQVRVPGRSTTGLALGRLGIAVAPSGASLTLRIANPANTLVGSTIGNVSVSQGGTGLFTHSIELAAFVPETEITYHVPWEGTPAQGTYRVKGELLPANAKPISFDRTVEFGRSAIRQYRRMTGRWAGESTGTPASLIAALALTVMLAVAFGVAYARARRQLRIHG